MFWCILSIFTPFIVTQRGLLLCQSLCRGYPSEFASYFHYCRSLRFDDKPDYAYLKRLFRDLFIREGLSFSVFLFIFYCVVLQPLITRWSCFNMSSVFWLLVSSYFRIPVWLCLWLDYFEISAITNCHSSCTCCCKWQCIQSGGIRCLIVEFRLSYWKWHLQGPAPGPSSGLPPAVVNADRQTSIISFSLLFLQPWYVILLVVCGFILHFTQQTCSSFCVDNDYFPFYLSFNSAFSCFYVLLLTLTFLVSNVATSV